MSTILGKRELASRIADRLEYSRSACEDLAEAVFDAVAEAVADGDAVRVPHFGVFRPKRVGAKTLSNPVNPRKTIHIAEHLTPAFLPAKAFRERLRTANGRDARATSGGES